jgi:HEAT repeat protein
MLEGLDGIDWSQLEHAYGRADDVPSQIRALLSPDPQERSRALRHLYSNIFHQGSRYEASAYAVPFLLELAADPRTPDRSAVLSLLASLAFGYDEAWLPFGFPVAGFRRHAEGGEEILRATPPLGEGEGEVQYRFLHWETLDDEAQARVYAYIELTVYDAVRAGVPVFALIVADAAAPVVDRRGAAYALAWFPEEASVSVPALLQAAADPDPSLSATALVALGLVGQGGDGVAVVEAALADPREVVQWGAAIALARLRGPAAGPRVAEVLLAWAGSGDERHDDIPYLEGDLSGYASVALRQLGTDNDEAAFDALLTRARLVSGTEALVVVGEALRRAFPDGAASAEQTFASMDERQRRLLTVLAESPRAWLLGEMPFGNFSIMLHGYGLPADPESMRRFVKA